MLYAGALSVSPMPGDETPTVRPGRSGNAETSRRFDAQAPGQGSKKAASECCDEELGKATTARPPTHSFAPNTPGSGQHRLLSTPNSLSAYLTRHCSSPSWL